VQADERAVAVRWRVLVSVGGVEGEEGRKGEIFIVGKVGGGPSREPMVEGKGGSGVEYG